MVIINKETNKSYSLNPNNKIAFDGCHKIYICENDEDLANFSSIKDKEITKGHLFDHIEFLSMPENEDEFKVLLQKVLDNYSNYN